MKAIKFDKEKVAKCIEAFYDQHDTYPYLICSDKTADFIKKSIDEPRPFESKITAEPKMSIGNICIAVNSSKPEDYGYFGGAMIMIDNALAFGEVLIVG